MATGKIKSLSPKGNNCSRQGEGKIIVDGTNAEINFHTPRDVDQTSVPLVEGDLVTFDLNNGALSNIQHKVVAPTCTLTEQTYKSAAGRMLTLSWTSQNADAVTIDNGIGNVSPVSGGSIDTPLISGTTTVYTLTATNALGQIATASVSV